jgi:sulfur-oxidizing protein SoxA
VPEHTHRITRVGALAILLAALISPSAAVAGPEEDRLAFVDFFQKRFPDIAFDEFANGIYAIDADARAQWMEIEEFPPYEFAIERGEAQWLEPFANGSTYADCYEQPVGEIRAAYPQFDAARAEVVTLELSINDCRAANSELPLEYDAGDMIDLSSYLAFAARGKKIDVQIPEDAPGALAAYEAGKRFYYSKRGQLNFACADCHVTSVGLRVRADRLSASLGHPTHFPVYRSKLGGMISLQQRFFGCVRDVRAKPFELQSPEYRNLEFFLAYMSNGLTINGPGARK